MSAVTVSTWSFSEALNCVKSYTISPTIKRVYHALEKDGLQVQDAQWDAHVRTVDVDELLQHAVVALQEFQYVARVGLVSSLHNARQYLLVSLFNQRHASNRSWT
jgi:hypothetical protein